MCHPDPDFTIYVVSEGAKSKLDFFLIAVTVMTPLLRDLDYSFYLGGGGGRSLNMAAKSSIPVALGTSRD
jgi:hypothetical protein